MEKVKKTMDEQNGNNNESIIKPKKKPQRNSGTEKYIMETKNLPDRFKEHTK